MEIRQCCVKFTLCRLDEFFDTFRRFCVIFRIVFVPSIPYKPKNSANTRPNTRCGELPMRLTKEQLAFVDTFGYLGFPGLL